MKIVCPCGNIISDNTDSMRHKGHLTPDQDLYAVWDGIDEQVIDRVATGDMPIEDAYMVSREIMRSTTRSMYQCFACGRLYVDGVDGTRNCFVPEHDSTDKGILRSRKIK